MINRLDAAEECLSIPQDKLARKVEQGVEAGIIKMFLLPLLSISISLSAQTILPQQNDRWIIQPDGSIEWKINNRLPHNDHIELSGEKVSLWMQYGVDTSGNQIL
jgi:hypothetical protein